MGGVGAGALAARVNQHPHHEAGWRQMTDGDGDEVSSAREQTDA